MLTLQDGTEISPGDLGDGAYRFDFNGTRLRVAPNGWTLEALEAVCAYLKAANEPKVVEKPKRKRRMFSEGG